MTIWFIVAVTLLIFYTGVLTFITVVHRHHRTPSQLWDLFNNRIVKVGHEVFPTKYLTGEYLEFEASLAELSGFASAERQALDMSAHLDATHKWCMREIKAGKPYEWSAGMHMCTLNETGCRSQARQYNWEPDAGADHKVNPWTRWVNGKCYNARMTAPVAGFCRQKIAEAVNDSSSTSILGRAGKHDDDGTLPSLYLAPGIACKNEGFCHWIQTAPPSCVLPFDYCERMGLNWERVAERQVVGYDGVRVQKKIEIGGCYETDVVAVLSMIFSATLVKTYKRNWDNMINQCEDKAFSTECASGVARFFGTPEQVALDSAIKATKENVDTWKRDCQHGNTSAHGTLLCLDATLDFIPGYWMGRRMGQAAYHLGEAMVKLLSKVDWPAVGHSIATGIVDAGQFLDSRETWQAIGHALSNYGAKALHLFGRLARKTGQVVFHAALAVARFGTKAFNALHKLVSSVASHAIDWFVSGPTFMLDAASRTYHLLDNMGHAALNLLDRGLLHGAGTLALEQAHKFVGAAYAVLTSVAAHSKELALETARVWFGAITGIADAFGFVGGALSAFLSHQLGAAAADVMDNIAQSFGDMADGVGSEAAAILGVAGNLEEGAERAAQVAWSSVAGGLASGWNTFKNGLGLRARQMRRQARGESPSMQEREEEAHMRREWDRYVIAPAAQASREDEPLTDDAWTQRLEEQADLIMQQ